MSSYDFGKPFSYLFEDHQWWVKLLIGAGLLAGAQMVRTIISYAFQFMSLGVMQFQPSSPGGVPGGPMGIGSSEITMLAMNGLGLLLGFILSMGVQFLVWGQTLRTFQNIVAGDELPIADWNAWRDDFVGGARIFAVFVAYGIPIYALAGGLIAILVVTGQSGGTDPNIEDIMAAIGVAGGCGVALITMLYFVLIPAPLMRVAATGRLGSAFELGELFRLVFGNFGNYMLAVLTAFVAMILSGFGVLLFCVGIFATRYWAYLITTHAFAQVYRIAYPSEAAPAPAASGPLPQPG